MVSSWRATLRSSAPGAGAAAGSAVGAGAVIAVRAGRRAHPTRMLVMMRAEMVVARREAVIGCRPLSDMVVARPPGDSRFQTSPADGRASPDIPPPGDQAGAAVPGDVDQAHGGNLVEQWLREMMVAPVE